jgi:hypothetical protein
MTSTDMTGTASTALPSHGPARPRHIDAQPGATLRAPADGGDHWHRRGHGTDSWHRRGHSADHAAPGSPRRSPATTDSLAAPTPATHLGSGSRRSVAACLNRHRNLVRARQHTPSPAAHPGSGSRRSVAACLNRHRNPVRARQHTPAPASHLGSGFRRSVAACLNRHRQPGLGPAAHLGSGSRRSVAACLNRDRNAVRARRRTLAPGLVAPSQPA